MRAPLNQESCNNCLSQEEEISLTSLVARMKEAKKKLPRTRSAIKRALLRGQIRQGERARQKLIESLDWICAHMARKFQGVYDVEYLDVYHSALLELCRAVDSFDPSRGISLSTYVWKPVQRGAARTLNSSGMGYRRPIRVVESRAKIRKKIEAAWQQGVKKEDLAHIVGAKPEEIDAVLTGDVEYLDERQEFPFLQSDISDWEEQESLWQALGRLSIIDRLVVGWLYDLGEESLSVTEVAKRLQISPQEVRKIKAGALQSLKQFLSDQENTQVFVEGVKE